MRGERWYFQFVFHQSFLLIYSFFTLRGWHEFSQLSSLTAGVLSLSLAQIKCKPKTHDRLIYYEEKDEQSLFLFLTWVDISQWMMSLRVEQAAWILPAMTHVSYPCFKPNCILLNFSWHERHNWNKKESCGQIAHVFLWTRLGVNYKY